MGTQGIIQLFIRLNNAIRDLRGLTMVVFQDFVDRALGDDALVADPVRCALAQHYPGNFDKGIL